MKSELRVIDSMYTRPRFAAIFLRIEGDEVALIETGTSRSLDLVLAEFSALGLRPEQVRYVVVTHAHLDHAGGAATMLETFPRASLVAHPRAARHLTDPSRLEASVRKVYGDAEFERLYGELPPVAEERVLRVEEGQELPFGPGSWTIWHTRGHAKHHLCLLDPMVDAIFTGDAFGLHYPELQFGEPFIFPSTSPTDFEGDEALVAVDRIASSGFGRAMPTHFGELRDLAGARERLRGHLEYSIEIASAARSVEAGGRQDFLVGRLRDRYARAIEAGKPGFLDTDLELNAAGIAWSIREAASA